MALSGVVTWGSPYFEGSGKHRVGAMAVRPELHVGAVAQIVDSLEQRSGVQSRHRMAAQSVGVPIEWGGDWTTFKDGPHFQLPWKTYP